MNLNWLNWKRDLCVAGVGALVAAVLLVPGGVYHLHAAHQEVAQLRGEVSDLRMENKFLRVMGPLNPIPAAAEVQAQ